MQRPGLYRHGSARLERGTFAIFLLSIIPGCRRLQIPQSELHCIEHLLNGVICSILNIVTRDVPDYNHAAGSTASMTIGEIPAFIREGYLSSLHRECTLLATGGGYGKIHALSTRGVIIFSASSTKLFWLLLT